jgi:hypothetical protein
MSPFFRHLCITTTARIAGLEQPLQKLESTNNRSLQSPESRLRDQCAWGYNLFTVPDIDSERADCDTRANKKGRPCGRPVFFNEAYEPGVRDVLLHIAGAELIKPIHGELPHIVVISIRVAPVEAGLRRTLTVTQQDKIAVEHD